MAGAVSRWLGSVEGLSEIVQRLLRVQIESAPAIEVIERYDSEETFFTVICPIHIARVVIVMLTGTRLLTTNIDNWPKY